MSAVGAGSVTGFGFFGSVSAWLTGKTRSEPTGQGLLNRGPPEWPGPFLSRPPSPVDTENLLLGPHQSGSRKRLSGLDPTVGSEEALGLAGVRGFCVFTGEALAKPRLRLVASGGGGDLEPPKEKLGAPP